MVLLTSPERRHRDWTALVESGSGWVLVRVRLRDRALARWRQLTLDAELAAGRPAARSRLRAVRAGMLTAPPLRQELARNWENVLAGAGTRSTVPTQRTRVLAAEDEIRQLITSLRAVGPVPARGVAIANLLLTDGSGPVYDPRSTADLRATVQDALHHLDPAAAHPR